MGERDTARPSAFGAVGPRVRAALMVMLVLAVLALWWALPSGGSTGVGPAGEGSGSTASGQVTSTIVWTATSTRPSALASTRSSTRTSGSRATAQVRPTRPTQVAPPRSDPRSKALAVLAVVDRTGEAPPGYVGGRQFMNDGRGGTAPLPRYDAARHGIVYHEYDVNPHRSGVDRGPQRLVVGDDGSAWYTGDHYVTWARLR